MKLLNSVEELILALGGPTATGAVAGVGPKAVSNWKARGFIPAEYFLTFSDELERRGKRADRAVFGFKVSTEARG